MLNEGPFQRYGEIGNKNWQATCSGAVLLRLQCSQELVFQHCQPLSALHTDCKQTSQPLLMAGTEFGRELQTLAQIFANTHDMLAKVC